LAVTSHGSWSGGNVSHTDRSGNPARGNFAGGGRVGRGGDNRARITSSRRRTSNPRTRTDRATASPTNPITPPANPTVVTTITGGRFDNGVLDVSIIPYMRSIDIQFIAEALRPSRRMYYFFDEKDILNYVLKPSIIELTTKVGFTGGFSNNDTVSVASNAAQVLISETDPNNNNKTFLYVANVRGTIVAGQTLTGSRRGNTGVVSAYIHCSGKATAGTSNTITLQSDAQTMANNYWGTSGANTVYLVSGTGLGQSATITGFDNNSRKLSITGTWTTNPAANTRYSIGPHFSTRRGSLAGTYVVPATNALRFRTGERIFRTIDISTGDVEDCSTRADYNFVAEGLNQLKNEVVIRSVTQTTVVAPPATPVSQPTRPRSSGDPDRLRNFMNNHHNGYLDPVAQTFFVPADLYPNGVFLTSVDLFFRTKDDFLPVIVQIRPTINGFPHSYEVYPGSEISIEPSLVNISELPNVADPTTATTFSFPQPVYLEPGEHALVVLTPSLNYEVFVSELGEKILGTNRIVSEQPYLGSLFKSQNATAWTPTQLEDLMFVLRKAKFVPSGTVLLKNIRPTSDIAADLMYAHADDHVFPNTTIAYTHSYDTGFSFANTTPDTNFVPTSRVTISASTDGTYQLAAALRTTDNSVSPILWTENYNFLAIENYINNANLSNLDISITSGGSGFDANANVALTINGGRADVPATAYALASASGNITSIIVTDGGEGYINTASLVISGANGTGALATMTGETSTKGGTARTKYISRIVTLAEGFEAGDLRVFVSAFKPSGTDIKVYYKIRNSLDPTKFDDQPYILMEQMTPDSVFSVDDYDILEFEYRPSLTQDFITYTSGSNTYHTFNQYAIKIVLLSDNTVKYPICFDMRGIALPSSEI
jgi:hypothetical protein